MENIELISDLKDLGLDINSEELNLSINSKKEILALLAPLSDFYYSEDTAHLEKLNVEEFNQRFKTLDSSGKSTQNIAMSGKLLPFHGYTTDLMGRGGIATGYFHLLTVGQNELSPELLINKELSHKDTEVLNKEWRIQLNKHYDGRERFHLDKEINTSFDIVMDDDHMQSCRYWTENGVIFRQTDTIDFRNKSTKRRIEVFDKQSANQIIQNFLENRCIMYENLAENMSRFIKVKELEPVATRNISVTLNENGSKTLYMTDESNNLLATSSIVDKESLDIPSIIRINEFVNDCDIYTQMVSSADYTEITGPAHK